MCELDLFIYGMYGMFGALGSYIIYRKTKLKFQIGKNTITVNDGEPRGMEDMANKDSKV